MTHHRWPIDSCPFHYPEVWNHTNWISNPHICVEFQLKHRCVGISSQNYKFPDDYYKMEKTLSEEEKQRINALLGKHRPREEIQGKEMVVLSEKGKKISIETEVASSSMKPFEDRLIEHEEEASKGKYEVIGTDIEMEYEEMDTEDEEHEVRRLTKEELEIYHQYKEFYTIQARTKGKMPGFDYIHRLKVKERYPGIPTDLAKTFSHPIEGEVQDIN